LFVLEAQKIFEKGIPMFEAKIAEKRFPKLPLGMPFMQTKRLKVQYAFF